MGWDDRSNANLVILGKKDHPKKVVGLLAEIKPDPKYRDNFRYTVIKKDGERVTVAGSTVINDKLTPIDIGHFIALEYTGVGTNARGQNFKNIDVKVHDGMDVTPEMKQWPGWKELNSSEAAQRRALRPSPQPKAAKPEEPEPPPPPVSQSLADFPEALEEEDDDLPF